MSSFEQTYFEFHRRGVFWANYCITTCCLIFCLPFSLIGLAFLNDAWNSLNNPILIVLVLCFFIGTSIYVLKDLKSKTPYHAYDNITIDTQGIRFFNAQSHRHVKWIHFTEIQSYKIRAIDGGDYAYFYLDLKMQNGLTDQVNLTFYMKPSEYEIKKIQLQEFMQYMLRSCNSQAF